MRAGEVTTIIGGTLKGILPEDDALTGITTDSRQVGPGMLFVAVRGSVCDGHGYIQEAVARGAGLIVAQRCPLTLLEQPCIEVADSQLALGMLASAWHGDPARNMTLIALTGTNGKTTTSWLIEGILRQAGYKTGVVGTVNYRYEDGNGSVIEHPAPLTTPDPMQLHGLLAEMAAHGVTHVIIEASSHALAQKRLAGLEFDCCIFTNLSRDHLDYHRSMEEYFLAKRQLFTDYLKKSGRAVVVMDETDYDRGYPERIAASIAPEQVLRVGLDANCEVRARVGSQGLDGMQLELDLPEGRKARFDSPLIGIHNVANILAATGAAFSLGIDEKDIAGGLASVDRIPGRLERVMLPGLAREFQPAAFVDYAHTPDGLAQVLTTLKALVPARLICVFGCGGDRDRGKRPEMGRIAGQLADLVILTSDNPRGEEPGAILADVAAGLSQSGLAELDAAALERAGGSIRGWTGVENRAEAIQLACRLSGPEDVLLIAGKGHEQYQILGSERVFFDDRIAVLDGLAAWNADFVLAATGGRLAGASPPAWQRYGSVSTDTRNLQSGDIFVALRGENFDGHEFVDEAVAKGAGLLVVEKVPGNGNLSVPVVQVADTLRALGDLARFRRDLFGDRVRVIGLTGSSGKTTVKEMVASICDEHLRGPEPATDRVLKTAGNFNNLIGLPLTLLRLSGRHRIAVLEMGMNQPGEIARLAGICRPDIGCINNVQAAHLLGLGSIDGVAAAKGELFAALPESSIAVVNCDDPLVVGQAARHTGRQIGYAATAKGRRRKPEVRITRIAPLGEQGSRLTLHIGSWRCRFVLPVPGRHNVANCAAAAAIAHAAGIGGPVIVRALSRFANIDKRMQFDRVPGGLKVVNDSYNANPSSMAAALETMASFDPRSRKLAALGDMLELGDAAPDAHREIGRLAARLGYTLLAVTGDYRQDVVAGARQEGMAKDRVMGFVDTVAMADWLYHLMISGRLGEDDWLLVKGSRGMRMENLLIELQNRFDPSRNGE
jgi:murE/murF fusion protein